MATTIRVTAADVSLYHVAAARLGDATQWWRIAQLNGMADPDLSGCATPVMLVLPTVDPSQDSGVPGVAS
ncbi:hypothetical protein DY926_07960 [Komagataeibacter melaceti]|uniref:LysM domain-containing protein n=1 Tax=Komagataeibacter melaceti TaxID=2766577 RepID=A0A371Z0S2_9PROT|nr:hypothetical protein [Komagataeibacter melaceti]RFD20083.1 hypothetical protein DY926_07960 [Komagataeibacter melaceti]